MYEQESITARPPAAYHSQPDEAFWTDSQDDDPTTPAAPAKVHRGRFQPGPDKRRHVFTTEECQAGFQAALESIIIRYPDAIMPDGRHLACNFLRTRQERRAA